MATETATTIVAVQNLVFGNITRVCYNFVVATLESQLFWRCPSCVILIHHITPPLSLLAFFTIMNAVEDDEISQRKGIVFLAHNMGFNNSCDHRTSVWYFQYPEWCCIHFLFGLQLLEGFVVYCNRFHIFCGFSITFWENNVMPFHKQWHR